MIGILTYNPVTGQDEDTDIRRLLIEILPHKDILFDNELSLINKLEKLARRLTVYEGKRIVAIHGRIIKQIRKG